MSSWSGLYQVLLVSPASFVNLLYRPFASYQWNLSLLNGLPITFALTAREDGRRGGVPTPSATRCTCNKRKSRCKHLLKWFRTVYYLENPTAVFFFSTFIAFLTISPEFLYPCRGYTHFGQKFWFVHVMFKINNFEIHAANWNNSASSFQFNRKINRSYTRKYEQNIQGDKKWGSLLFHFLFIREY